MAHESRLETAAQRPSEPPLYQKKDVKEEELRQAPYETAVQKLKGKKMMVGGGGRDEPAAACQGARPVLGGTAQQWPQVKEFEKSRRVKGVASARKQPDWAVSPPTSHKKGSQSRFRWGKFKRGEFVGKSYRVRKKETRGPPCSAGNLKEPS